MDDTLPSESAGEYAARIGKSEQTIHRWIKRGKLKGFKRPTVGTQFQWRVYLDQSVPDGDAPDNDGDTPRNDDGEGGNTTDDTRLIVLKPLIDGMTRERAEERAQFLDALARARQEVGFYQGLLLAQATREEEPQAVESPPTEDVSHAEAPEIAPGSFWTRFRAWWGG